MSISPITLTDGVTVLELTPDLVWTDEFDWDPVMQTEDYSLSGALVIDVQTKQSGRAITLESESDGGWVTRGQLAQLAAWRAIPGQVLTLGLRGHSYSVVFRRQEGAVTSKPVISYADPEPSDVSTVTIRFMEI